MAFCGNCGAQVQDGVKFCPGCGQAMAAAPAPQAAYAPPPQQAAPPQAAYAPPAQAGYTPPQPSPQAAPYAPPAAPAGAGYAPAPQAPAQGGYAPPPPAQQYAPQAQPYQPPLMPGAPGQADIRDAQDNKAMAILAYIIFFIPLIAGVHKTSPFVKYHTNQGTVLAIAAMAIAVVFGIISAIITGVLTATLAWGAALTLASIFGIVWMLFGFGMMALVVVGIINAAGGKMKPLPIIGKFTIIK